MESKYFRHNLEQKVSNLEKNCDARGLLKMRIERMNQINYRTGVVSDEIKMIDTAIRNVRSVKRCTDETWKRYAST